MLMTDIAVSAPSVFANKPKPGVSERYQFLPTVEIVNTMIDNGFVVRKVDQRKSRKRENRVYAKHMIQFRKEGDLNVGDVFPENLINSHHKTTPFTFRVGFFRFVCSNGLIVGDSVFPALKFKHNTTNTIDLVLDNIDQQWKVFEDLIPEVQEMRNKILNEYTQNEFAHRVNMEFFEDRLINPTGDLLKVRRWDDSAPNLWTVFNRISNSGV